MGTMIRPELSEKNKYWIEKHRYYELKHFCLQYPSWKKAREALNGYPSISDNTSIFLKTNVHSDPTAKLAVERAFYSKRMDMVEQTAIAADSDLYVEILRAVTQGESFEYLKARLEIPCSRDMYYDRYRRFFYLLNEVRH